MFYLNIGSGTLVVGQQYMVLQGVVQHNAVNYGPGQATTVFTAVNVNYTIISGVVFPLTAQVIEYSPEDLQKKGHEGYYYYDKSGKRNIIPKDTYNNLKKSGVMRLAFSVSFYFLKRRLPRPVRRYLNGRYMSLKTPSAI